MIDNVKVLIVENEPEHRLEWINGLASDGVDIGGGDPKKLADAIEAIHTFTFGQHVIHFIGNQENTANAVRGLNYDLCFMNRFTKSGVADDAVWILLTESLSFPTIVLTGTDAMRERTEIAETYYQATEEALDPDYIYSGTKAYAQNRLYLAKVLGFRDTAKLVVKGDGKNRFPCPSR